MMMIGKYWESKQKRARIDYMTEAHEMDQNST